MKILCGLAILSLMSLSLETSARADFMLTSSTLTYGENFNSYNGLVDTVPANWSITSAVTPLPMYRGTGTGTATAGGFYAFGTASDFSLGVLRSGSTNPFGTFAITFNNGTGSTITDLAVSFNYEQWRNGGGTNNSGFDLTGTGDLAGNSSVNSADFAGNQTGASGTVKSTPISLTLAGLSITNGSSFGFSFVTTDASGADNGVSIDDFSLSATLQPVAVPEPSSLALVAFAGLGAVTKARRRPKIITGVVG